MTEYIHSFLHLLFLSTVALFPVINLQECFYYQSLYGWT